jgi:hypothetical protein
MTGAIGVRFSASGHCELGSGPPADVGAIDAALGVMRWAVTRFRRRGAHRAVARGSSVSGAGFSSPVLARGVS